jgi:hypothetical protein
MSIQREEKIIDLSAYKRAKQEAYLRIIAMQVRSECEENPIVKQPVTRYRYDDLQEMIEDYNNSLTME